jgi:hypothetical protein
MLVLDAQAVRAGAQWTVCAGGVSSRKQNPTLASAGKCTRAGSIRFTLVGKP